MGFNQNDKTLESLYAINNAKSIHDINKASKSWVVPAMNMVMIDKKNIAYRLVGKIPHRRDSGRCVTSKLWKGMVPSRLNPAIINPEKGYIANSNNQIIHSSYKYLLIL